jgi:hypothetical protein
VPAVLLEASVAWNQYEPWEGRQPPKQMGKVGIGESSLLHAEFQNMDVCRGYGVAMRLYSASRCDGAIVSKTVARHKRRQC